MSASDYQLIDFGDGRKLESLAGHLVDRPSPAAEGNPKLHPARWSDADSIFAPPPATPGQAKRRWVHRRAWPPSLVIDCGRFHREVSHRTGRHGSENFAEAVAFRMPVRPTPSGHIGLFPEQADNWRWLMSTSPPSSRRTAGNAGDALNLFAYTGASTLALIAAGFRVAHVDAAKPNVQATRRAAQVNGWSDAPIRYLVDDAATFAAREVRRGRRYHTIVLDPPAYGHTPKGKAWRLERDLWPLLENCTRLLDPANFRLLITGHSPQVDQHDVAEFLRVPLGTSSEPKRHPATHTELGRSQLIDSAGRALDAGFFVRVCRGTLHG